MGKIIQFRSRGKEGDSKPIIDDTQDSPSMGELVQFKQAGEQREDKTADSGGETGDLIKVSIPSLAQLYDESALSIFGSSVEELRTDQGDLSGPERNDFEEKLEIQLLMARGLYIKEHVPQQSHRRQLLQELGEHTFNVGLNLDSEPVLDSAVRVLTNVLGVQRAATITQNLRIKHNIRERQ